jgi:hypothetical protein
MDPEPGQKLSDIVYGIRYCVAKADEGVKLELDDVDYSVEAKQTFNLLREVKDKKRSFFFKDYAPHAFAHIRKFLKTNPESFLQSWSMPDEEAELSQSTARSGSMFYSTPDKKYLFKTILHPEVQVMMTILRDYYLIYEWSIKNMDSYNG